MFLRSFRALFKLRSDSRPVSGARRVRKRFQPDAMALEPRIALADESHSAYEIAYVGDVGSDFTGPVLVYLAGGSNPIDAEEWSSYQPPPGYLKNTTRNLEFNSATFLSSPDSTTDEYITTSDGYTWFYMAKTISSDWPFVPAKYPANYSSGYEAASLETTPPKGVIKWTANTKNQEITWYARNSDGKPIERYFVTDPWGDRFIMQATGQSDPALVRRNFLKAVLPHGWTKSIGFLKQNLTTLPAYNSDGSCNYYLFRDSADDSFEQISWGKRGWGTSQMIAGMPIWGGTNNNNIRLNPKHDNVVYTAGGNDAVYVSGLINTIYGDGGIDLAVFHGPRSRFTVTDVTSDGSEIIVTPRGPAADAQVTTLYDVEQMRFVTSNA